jgi:hypothetical protein
MYRLQFDEIIDRCRMRELNEAEGRMLRQARLHQGIDPDSHIPRIYMFELWKNIIETYARTTLSKPEDKLVALSGIARRMAGKLGKGGKPARYLAGLWRPYLASQLLWKVEAEFDDHHQLFRHRSTRPKNLYRAPSFSWASVDTEHGKGIVYGEVTDQNIYVKIKGDDVKSQLSDEMQKYGMVVEGAGIQLEGKLRQIVLFLFSDSGNGPAPNEAFARDRDACTDQVGWRLLQGRRCCGVATKAELEVEDHANTYMDCFSADRSIVLNSRRTYCLPVAKGERINGEDHLICLLLIEADGHERGTFRRIGLTKLSRWADKVTYHHIFHVCAEDKDLPSQKYDKTGNHLIRII